MRIIFDIGGIFCHVNFDNFSRELYNCGICDPQQFLNDLQWKQDIGISDVRTELSRYPNAKSNMDRLLEIWNSCLIMDLDMIAFKNELQDEGVEVALLSNIGRYHAEHIGKAYPELYSGSIKHFSYEVGVRKPSRLYYQSFLMDHPEFKGSLYMDDRRENLEMGARVGLQPFYFLLSSFDGMRREVTLDKIRKEILRKI